MKHKILIIILIIFLLAPCFSFATNLEIVEIPITITTPSELENFYNFPSPFVIQTITLANCQGSLSTLYLDYFGSSVDCNYSIFSPNNYYFELESLIAFGDEFGSAKLYVLGFYLDTPFGVGWIKLVIEQQINIIKDVAGETLPLIFALVVLIGLAFLVFRWLRKVIHLRQ